MKSNNPIYKTLEKQNYIDSTDVATYTGVMKKTFFLFSLAIFFGLFSFYIASVNEVTGISLAIIGSIIAFVTVLIVIFSRRISPVIASIYAIAEGVVLGSTGFFINSAYPGSVVAALFATIVIFALLLTLYATGIFKVGRQFRKFFYTAMLGAFILYFGLFIASLFSASARSFFYDSPIMIGISLIFVVLASFRLVISFDDANNVVSRGATQKEEWTVSFGLLFATIWLYVEILNLIIRLSRFVKN